MWSSAMNVLLNGGKAKLIGHRPAISQRPKKRTNESSCQTTGLTIRLVCSTVSAPGTPLKNAHLPARSHRGKELFKPFNTFKQFKTLKNTKALQPNAGSVWAMEHWGDASKRDTSYIPTLHPRCFHFTLASAAFSGARYQKSATLRFSPLIAPERP